MISIVRSIEDRKALKDLFERNQFEFVEVNNIVEKILKDVKGRGDIAIREYALKFDRVELDDLRVSNLEIKKAFKNIDINLRKDLEEVKENIEEYHSKQILQPYTINKNNEIILEQIIRAIDKVGIYVPGGSAAYPSTVLMNAIPAKIAGVEETALLTPPDEKGQIKDSILVAASIAGIDKIFKVGGAQAIAALTFGTQSIPKVSKIVGPGNIYVTMAKKMVSGYVGIDMIAGPSEILIIADETSNPEYVAADLLSQAEHDELAAPILVTDSQKLADGVVISLEKQIEDLERKNIIQESLKNHGAIILTNSIEESVNIANEIAPEHLEILTENPFDVGRQIKNAGAIFLGEFSPEPLGDYYAGTNHVLPTSGTARFSSPLSVIDFLKRSSLIYYSKEALGEAKDSIIRIAENEGLTAHGNAIKIRFEEE